MAAKKVVRVTEEELALLQQLRAGKAPEETELEDSTPDPTRSAHKELAEAFVEAIERTKPPVIKTVATRKRRTPWSPPDGEAQVKMKRKFYQHGILILRASNEEIELLNKIRPGSYCEGYVKVTLRKDRGIDIDYPVRTAAQRLRLVNSFGIRNFVELLQRIIAENAAPHKFRRPEDADLYDIVNE